MDKIGVVYSTFSNNEDAKSTVKTLMDDRLVTCANILAPHTAIYPWKGDICEEQEVSVLFKMPHDKVNDMTQKLREIHPYDLPAIIELDAKALPDYADWLKSPLQHPEQFWECISKSPRH